MKYRKVSAGETTEHTTPPSCPDSIPLAVDLDGTLIRTDSLVEALILLFKTHPFLLPLFFIWILKGKAYLKQEVGRRITIDVSGLPYNLDVLNFLRDQHHLGRKIVLATAPDQTMAGQIAEYLHMFDQVFASDGRTNLSGMYKRDRLVREFGPSGFDYIGNSAKDLVVFRAARSAFLVGSQNCIERYRKAIHNLEKVFEVKTGGSREWIRAIRLYQWLKNVLVFVPLLAAQRYMEFSLLFSATLAFLSFGFCASSVYILNDLLDLSSDRRHPRKRFRPFASGVLPLWLGIVSAPLLLGMSLLVALPLPNMFYLMLGGYYAMTLAYSLRLKNIVVLDVILLAALFTIRMMAGSGAVEIWPSSWLLAHSMFLFTSLALVKRYAELVTMRLAHGEGAKARSYVVGDSELLAAMGVASAFVSALVLVLYITSGSAQFLYARHQVIWLVCPFLLYWLCYIWLVAHRGNMLDDPLVFAMKDRVSRITIGCMAIIMILAS